MKVFYLLILSNILMCAAVLASGKEEISYSFRSINFRDGTFPEKINVILQVPASMKYYPSMVAVNRDTVGDLGTVVKKLEENNGLVKFLVEIDVTKCEHLLGGDHSWRITDLQGPKVVLHASQRFIPLIYFKNCMIGLSVGDRGMDDPVIQKWLKDSKNKPISVPAGTQERGIKGASVPHKRHLAP